MSSRKTRVIVLFELWRAYAFYTLTLKEWLLIQNKQIEEEMSKQELEDAQIKESIIRFFEKSQIMPWRMISKVSNKGFDKIDSQAPIVVAQKIYFKKLHTGQKEEYSVVSIRSKETENGSVNV